MNKKKVKSEDALTKQEVARQHELMRERVIGVELQARFWKAQYDVRLYTLEAEKLQPAYLEYLKEQQKVTDELNKQYEDNLEKLKANPELTIEALQSNESSSPVEPTKVLEEEGGEKVI